MVDGAVKTVSVEMGKVSVGRELDLIVDGHFMSCIPVSVGNPHAVFFTDDAECIALSKIGPMIEHDPVFPGGVNAEFVQVISRNELRMRVWERGSGITLACGTGACASVSASVSKGYFDVNQPVVIHLDGGDLSITVREDYSVLMTGPAEFVYEGDML